MRVGFFLLTLSLATFFLYDARAFPDGAPWGAANPAAEQDCAACHFGVEPVHASDALAIYGLPQKLEAGVTYDLAITFEDPSIVVAGFQLIAQAVEQDVGTEVGFELVFLDVEAVGAAEDLPVDVPQVVAGDVLAVLGELDAVAVVGAAVHSGDESGNHRARPQVESAQPRENFRS